MQWQIIKSIILVSLVVSLIACTTVREGGYRKDPKKAAEINTDLGKEYIKMHNLERAKYVLEKALSDDPKLPAAHGTYAHLQLIMGDIKMAEKHYRKALRLQPNNPEFLNNYGTLLYHQNRLKEAEESFLKALKAPLYKTREDVYANLGNCALKAKDYSRAENYYKKALQLQANHPDALYKMAFLNGEREQYGLADAYLKRYHDLGIRSPESLYFAVELAVKLGNNNDRASYTLLLKDKFPDSKQAQRLRANRN